jgi:hypothetical protein
MKRAVLAWIFGVLVFSAIDVSVFRTGLYWSVIEPNSTLGSVKIAFASVSLLEAEERTQTDRKPVLVLGDSRVGEGFSARLANAHAAELNSPIRFVNGAMAGAPPKTLYYLSRALDPSATRFSAIVLMTSSLADDQVGFPHPCWWELAYIHPFVGVADLPDLITDCWDDGVLERTVLSLFVAGYNYRLDLQALLADVPDRLHRALLSQHAAAESMAAYEGNPNTLEGMSFDVATGTIKIPDELPPARAQAIRDYASLLMRLTEELPMTHDYRRRWITRLAKRYSAANVPVILVRLPRGPLHYLVSGEHPISPFLEQLRKERAIRIADPATLSKFERPECFFDALHVNKVGREGVSRRLAESVISILNQ